MEDFVVLNNGVRMPRVGLGVYAIPVNQTKDAVLTALSLGYRHIDTAQLYKNEAEVGEAVRASGIPRNEIFVTTKLWARGIMRTRSDRLPAPSGRSGSA